LGHIHARHRQPGALRKLAKVIADEEVDECEKALPRPPDLVGLWETRKHRLHNKSAFPCRCESAVGVSQRQQCESRPSFLLPRFTLHPAPLHLFHLTEQL
jgi:hypothetical protein